MTKRTITRILNEWYGRVIFSASSNKNGFMYSKQQTESANFAWFAAVTRKIWAHRWMWSRVRLFATTCCSLLEISSPVRIISLFLPTTLSFNVATSSSRVCISVITCFSSSYSLRTTEFALKNMQERDKTIGNCLICDDAGSFSTPMVNADNAIWYPSYVYTKIETTSFYPIT